MDDWKYRARGPSYSAGPEWYYIWSGEFATDSERPIGDAFGEANAKLMVLLPKMRNALANLLDAAIAYDLIASNRADDQERKIEQDFHRAKAHARHLLAKIEGKE